MSIQDVLTEAKDAITVKRVFGEPIEHDGVIVIPAAAVRGGGGGGSGEAPVPTPADTHTDTESDGVTPAGHGEGGGFGISGRPVGAFVIRGSEVQWEPAHDPTREMLLSTVVVLTAILASRSVAKAGIRLAAKKRHAMH